MKTDQGNFLYTLSKIRQNIFAYLEAEMSAKNISGISPSDGDIIFVLDIRGPLTLLEIARYTMKDKSTVSPVIKKLEKSGYVTKEKQEHDGRFVKIKLTARAKKLKPRLLEISGAMNLRIFNGLTEEEKSMLFSLISRVHDNTVM